MTSSGINRWTPSGSVDEEEEERARYSVRMDVDVGKEKEESQLAFNPLDKDSMEGGQFR